MMNTIKFKRLEEAAKLPVRQHPGDAGADVSACRNFTLPAGGFVKVGTGLAAEIPEGWEIQVRPRSGLAAKYGIFAVFGTIDSGYRGEIGVTLVNMGDKAWDFEAGERIAQLVPARVRPVAFEEAAELADGDRGTAGFGSTGT